MARRSLKAFDLTLFGEDRDSEDFCDWGQVEYPPIPQLRKSLGEFFVRPQDKSAKHADFRDRHIADRPVSAMTSDLSPFWILGRAASD
jgi:hypothetical protein